jgi:hypothetical protein
MKNTAAWDRLATVWMASVDLVGKPARGIADLPGDRFCPLLQVLKAFHGSGLNLLRFALELVAGIAGQLSIGRFQLAFGVFGFGIETVGHGRSCDWRKDELCSSLAAAATEAVEAERQLALTLTVNHPAGVVYGVAIPSLLWPL